MSKKNSLLLNLLSTSVLFYTYLTTTTAVFLIISITLYSLLLPTNLFKIPLYSVPVVVFSDNRSFPLFTTLYFVTGENSLYYTTSLYFYLVDRNLYIISFKDLGICRIRRNYSMWHFPLLSIICYQCFFCEPAKPMLTLFERISHIVTVFLYFQLWCYICGENSSCSPCPSTFTCHQPS